MLELEQIDNSVVSLLVEHAYQGSR